jgi:UDP-glucose 4-epimerase
VAKSYGPAQPGDVRQSWADVSAAREAIGYEAAVGFEEGLRRTIDAMVGREGANV